MSDSRRERRSVRYRGTVQGVGFRYSTQRCASGYDVTGFVRNLPNGEVELVVEGRPEQLSAFLGSVRKAMKECIVEAIVESSDATGDFDSFSIRY